MNNSTRKVLIVYDGRLGSTAEVATFIGDVLAERGASVDVRQVAEVNDPNTYDLVIVGSAIRYDHLLPDAINFVRSHQAALSRRPVAYFFTCLTLASVTPEAQAKAEQYATKLRRLTPEVRPISIGGFGGVLNFKRAPILMRILLRILSLLRGVKEGDYRNWEAIYDWAIEILPMLDKTGVERQAA